VRPEDAAQDVRLVDGHDLQVAQKVGPGLVVGQDADVQHVGVRKQDVRPAPDVRAEGVRRVAIIGRRMDSAQAEVLDLAELILGEGLRRVEEDSPTLRPAQRVLKSWDLVAQRLPTSRRRRYHHVLTDQDPLVRLQLMRVQPRSAHLTQCLRELRPEVGELY
jgi:hypothetical protein